MIATNLTPANGPMNRLVANVAQRYQAVPGSNTGHEAALKQIWHLAYAQAPAAPSAAAH